MLDIGLLCKPPFPTWYTPFHFQSIQLPTFTCPLLAAGIGWAGCRDGVMDQVERLIIIASGDELSGHMSALGSQVGTSLHGISCRHCRRHQVSVFDT